MSTAKKILFWVLAALAVILAALGFGRARTRLVLAETKDADQAEKNARDTRDARGDAELKAEQTAREGTAARVEEMKDDAIDKELEKRGLR